jgi:hypothetical protein
MTTKVNAWFEEDPGFELAPVLPHPAQKVGLFEQLKSNLLDKALAETETLSLHPHVKLAANEAAALSWTTAFPILVFPALLSEKVQTARVQAQRQQGILARTEDLMACPL